MEAPVALVLSRLSSLLQSDLASYSKAGEGKTLLVSGNLSGLQFTWQFHFSPAPRSAVGPTGLFFSDESVCLLCRWSSSWSSHS